MILSIVTWGLEEDAIKFGTGDEDDYITTEIHINQKMAWASVIQATKVKVKSKHVIKELTFYVTRGSHVD